VLTVTAVNDTPTISAILDQTTLEDTATGAITFTVGDVETAATSLTVTATSSDLGVVAANGIVLGGSGANRTITLTPVADASGTSTITVTVADGGGLTATQSFVLTVTPVSDVPESDGFLVGAGLMPASGGEGRFLLQASLGQAMAGNLPVVSGFEWASGFWVASSLAEAMTGPLASVPTPAQAARGLAVLRLPDPPASGAGSPIPARAQMASGVRLPEARMSVAPAAGSSKVRIAVSGLPKARWKVQSLEGFGSGAWRDEGVLLLDGAGEGVIETGSGDGAPARFYRLVQP